MNNLDSGTIIYLDRSRPFNLTSFTNKIGTSVGWVVTNNENKGLQSLVEVNAGLIELKSMIRKGENFISGRVQIKRLEESGYIPLDGKFFEIFWNHQGLIPKHWAEKIDGKMKYISFGGSRIARDKNGVEYIFFLYMEYGKWKWGHCSIDNNCDPRCLSAALPLQCIKST